MTNKVVTCKLQHSQGQPTVTRSVTVNDDLTWHVRIHGQTLYTSKCVALKCLPVTVKTKIALNRLLKLVDSLNICAGHPEDHFLDLADSRKGKFQSAGNSTVAFIDTYYPVSLNGKEYSRTIRTSACELLVHGPKCDVCKKYRSSLRSQQLYREAKIDSIPDYQKYVCLVFDEVKVKEDLVYIMTNILLNSWALSKLEI